MKKFSLILILIIFCSVQTRAACDYSKMCAPEPYDLSSKACRITSRTTGMTFLAEKIVQFIIKKELKKATKERFKAEIKSYSAKDLLQGRFKSLKISGKNLEMEGVYLTRFEAKTICDFNYVGLEKNSIKFKENMAMKFLIEISDKDLRKTVKSTSYLDRLNKIKFSGLGITFLKLDGADVQIKNNKLYFTINVTSPVSSKPIPMIINSDLKVENGRIVITKLKFVNLCTLINLSRAACLLNTLNPLSFSMEVLDNKNSKMNIQTVDIIDDKIIIEGNIFIPKNSIKK